MHVSSLTLGRIAMMGVIVTLGFFIFSDIASAQAISSKSVIPDFKFSVPFPGFAITGDDFKNGAAIGKYTCMVYRWTVGFAAVLAMLMVVVGGYWWLFGKPDKAREIIQNALIGLILALGSYLILYVVNPVLVECATINLKPIENLALDIKKIEDLSPQFVENVAKENKTYCGLVKAVFAGTNNETLITEGLANYLSRLGRDGKIGELKNADKYTYAVTQYLNVLGSTFCPSGSKPAVCDQNSPRMGEYIMAAFYGGVDVNKESLRCPGKTQWECLSDPTFTAARSFVSKSAPVLQNFKPGDACIDTNSSKIKVAAGTPTSVATTSLRGLASDVKNRVSFGSGSTEKLNLVTMAKLEMTLRDCMPTNLEIIKAYDQKTPAFATGQSIEIRNNPENWSQINMCFNKHGFCRLTKGKSCNPYHFEYAGPEKSVSENCQFNFYSLEIADPKKLCPNIIN